MFEVIALAVRVILDDLLLQVVAGNWSLIVRTREATALAVRASHEGFPKI